MKSILVILVVFLSVNLAFSQVPENFGQERDEVDAKPTTKERDSTTIVDNSIFDIFYGNPGKAAFYGLIIPGGGQIYNKKWWKLPFVYAIEGGTIYWIIHSTNNYSQVQKDYEFALENPKGPFMVGDVEVSSVGIVKSNRDKWRKQREYSWVFFIGGHLLTLFEAFIDRHLIEFDVSDDLTFQPIPSAVGALPGVTYTISLNKKKDTVIKDVWTD